MKYIVTGGGGFLGKALCLRLRDDDHQVVSISRSRYPELEQQGVHCIQADIADDLSPLAQDLAGADAVFHAAAKVSMWGKYDDFYRVNVQGTRNVIQVCREAGIPKLVFTSSPSVVADGSDLRGIDESYPYPETHKAFYPQTKAIAEREVLKANDEKLFTIALRPHLIWGPGDTNLLPAIIKRAASGRLRKIGKGDNRVDLTFIDDCVDAHLRALYSLGSNPDCRGKVYFISQGDPVRLWDWINEVLSKNKLQPVRKSIPTRLAVALAAAFETFSKLLPGEREPLLTRFLVSEMATDHYFDISAAGRDIGFRPRYSIADAMAITFG